MDGHALGPLLAPRSIALVGASQRPNTPGHDMVRMLERGGFRGVAHAINPNYRTIESYPCVPSLAELPSPPDLAVLSVRNERLEATLAEAIAVGARSAVIFASGYLADDRDPPLTQRLAAMARARGCRSAAATAWASTTISTTCGSADFPVLASRGRARSRSSRTPAACSVPSPTTTRGCASP
jgi:acyl-CoA synthetase (NDP forming)